MADLWVKAGSVVIGRNAGDRLLRCLASLKAPRGPLVHVDGASTDGMIVYK